MNKEVISNRQGISVMAMFIIGTSSIVVTGLKSKQDLWLALILSIFISFFIILIYSRLHYLFPDKDLFHIIEICLGKFIGKIINILYIFYLLLIGSSILWIVTGFIKKVSLSKTPQVVLMISVIFISSLSIKKGIELIGRWTEVFLPILVCFIIILVLLLIPKMNISNLQPSLSEGIDPILKGSFSALLFPFAQIVVLTMAFSNFQNKKSPYKIYMSGLLIGAFFIFVMSLTDILVLGVREASLAYFPTYYSAERIDIKGYLQRLEIIIAIAFILGAFVKFSIYLLAICKGIPRIFGFTNYRFIVMPVSLIMINTCYSLYDNILYFYEWIEQIWPYFSTPFHIILPIIIWIFAEIKYKKLNKNKIP